jgi:glycosyltransferase involved in cell wall biosynthesis
MMFTKLMAEAFAIVHPTREDTSPLVLTEAAYFGCPAVSVNRFAIPELVTDGVTGILVDAPASAVDVAGAIARMIENDDAYRAMRHEARERAIARFSWPAIGKFMSDRIDERLSA